MMEDENELTPTDDVLANDNELFANNLMPDGDDKPTNESDSTSEDSIVKNIFLFKFKFKLEDAHQYCMGLLGVNFSSKSIIHTDILVAPYSYSIANVDVYKDWYAFIHKFALIRANVEPVIAIEKDIVVNINTKLNNTTILDIQNYLQESENFEYIKDIFVEVFKRVFVEDFPIDYHVENISEASYSEGKKKLAELQEQSNAIDSDMSQVMANSTMNNNDGFFDVPMGEEILVCQPVLAPVSGRVIQELSQGDVIMVRVNGNKLRNKSFRSSTKLFFDAEGNEIPIPATIEKIEFSSSTGNRILVKLNQFFHGTIIEFETVKIKDVKSENTAKKNEATSLNSVSILLILLTAVLLIVAIIIFSSR